MKLIHRYLIRELLITFLLGIVLFTSILLFEQLFDLTDLVVNKGLSLFTVGYLVILGIPETFSLSIPMALVLATLLVYGRWAGDLELTALRASGVPLYQLVLPTIAIALFISVFLLGLKQWGFPQLAHHRAKTLASVKVTNPINLIKPRTHLSLGPLTIYADAIDGSTMKNVEIIDERKDPPLEIYSKHGQWTKQDVGDFQLTLKNGTLHQTGKGRRYRVLKFQTHTINLPSQSDQQPEEVAPPKKTLIQLWEQYQELGSRLEENKDDSNDQLKKEYRQAGLDWHRSLAFSFATVFLIIVAAPLGMMCEKTGKSVGMIISLAIIFVYYLLITVGEPAALNGSISPWLAMWGPNVLSGLSGAGLLGYMIVHG